MKTLFEILPKNMEADKCCLTLEISDKIFSYTIKDGAENSFIAVAMYQPETSGDSTVDTIKEFFNRNDFLKNSFAKTGIIYSGNECVMIPFNLYSSIENNHVLNLVHGDIWNNHAIQTDLVAEAGIYNVYRTPKDAVDFFSETFPRAVKTHLYSALLKKQQPDNSMLLIFYPDHFILKLKTGNKIQLINTYYYAAAEDVSYILLNVCEQHNAQNVELFLSGLIEKDSALYKNVYKYFETIHFETLPGNYIYSEAIQEQPAHYFSHLFATDLCE